MNRAAVFQVADHGDLTEEGNKRSPQKIPYGFAALLCKHMFSIVLSCVVVYSRELMAGYVTRSLTVMPLTVPSSSRMVKTSSRAWVGCSPTPSPALITGLRQWRDAVWVGQEEAL